ncbi:MAG: SpoIVB peptidase [Acutalibacteraceae bacterium]
MKRNFYFKSFLSVTLAIFLMFSFFTLNTLNDSIVVDNKLNGVTGRIQEFGNSIKEYFSNSTNTENQYKSISSEQVYIGGFPIGLKLYADGALVVATESVDTPNGSISPAEKAGLKVGDIIKKVNNKQVKRNSDVSDIIQKSNGESIIFVIERDGIEETVSFKSEYSISEKKYKAGIWIRDSSAGIGMVTFITKTGEFASLGHAVCDIDTGETLPIASGECTDVVLTGFIKGQSGQAGELCGYLENNSTGIIYNNCNIGVYGRFNNIPNQSEAYSLAEYEEVTLGEAEIVTTIENNQIKRYKINIEKINFSAKNGRDFIIEVTDEELIKKTGGIIQGMSGSPIIQNGKIVGAVTHVFLDDSKSGFGIYVGRMYECLK